MSDPVKPAAPPVISKLNPDDFEFGDKIPMRDFVRLFIAEYTAGATQAEEEAGGQYRWGSVNAVSSQYVRPARNKETGEWVLWVDNKEPSKELKTDIPINILRNPGT
jgi:hypothetical protein